jgi:hypothetical protein
MCVGPARRSQREKATEYLLLNRVELIGDPLVQIRSYLYLSCVGPQILDRSWLPLLTVEGPMDLVRSQLSLFRTPWPWIRLNCRLSPFRTPWIW